VIQTNCSFLSLVVSYTFRLFPKQLTTNMATRTPITVAHGDGMGPEIMADRVVGLGLEVAMTENLWNYDGKAGLTLAQGQ